MRMTHFYYSIKPVIPRSMQLFLRRQLIRGKHRQSRRVWPIHEASKKPPEGWQGWPEKKKFALVLTHDVDTAKGAENCKKLMKMEMDMGFRSSYNFVPERYTVPAKLRHELTANGFEVGVHGLIHDGKLFQTREIFKARAIRINRYIEEWQASGFRAPAMHYIHDWIHDLNIEYDASTFDTDPFEPQPDGIHTIFPFWVHNGSPVEGYVELPYTLPQDFTLFVLMGHKDIDIWRKKLDWLAVNGGMALINVHPDYMNFNGNKCGPEEYPAHYYQQFLEYVKKRYAGEYWHVLPKEMARIFNLKIKKKNPAGETLTEKPHSALQERKMSSSNEVPYPVRKKVWIDLDNSPHVLFFDPIIKELKTRGYDVVVTARDYAQVIGLSELFELEYTKIGRHYGKHLLLKILGLMVRTCELIPFVLREKPDLAISHGSRGQALAAGMTRIPAMMAFDYEYTARLSFFRPAKIIVPEVLVKNITARNTEEIYPYPGIKEDVYAQSHRPDSAFTQAFNLNEDDIVATIRPPATLAHYYVPKSEEMFESVIEHLARQPGLKVIIVPRTKEQGEEIRKRWPDHFSSGSLIIPEQVVNGLDIIWFSDLVISAGGTMIREAAALGVPAYSIFGGKIGAVDQYLAESGRLTLIGSPEEVKTSIRIEKWQRPEKPQPAKQPTLSCIVDAVEEMLS